MEKGLTMLMAMISLLSFLAGSLPFAVLFYLRERMHQEETAKWMRIFSVASLQIPKGSMDVDAEEKPPAEKKPDTRKKLSFALPVPDYAKNVYRSLKRGN